MGIRGASRRLLSYDELAGVPLVARFLRFSAAQVDMRLWRCKLVDLEPLHEMQQAETRGLTSSLCNLSDGSLLAIPPSVREALGFVVSCYCYCSLVRQEPDVRSPWFRAIPCPPQDREMRMQARAVQGLGRGGGPVTVAQESCLMCHAPAAVALDHTRLTLDRIVHAGYFERTTTEQRGCEDLRKVKGGLDIYGRTRTDSPKLSPSTPPSTGPADGPRNSLVAELA